MRVAALPLLVQNDGAGTSDVRLARRRSLRQRNNRHVMPIPILPAHCCICSQPVMAQTVSASGRYSRHSGKQMLALRLTCFDPEPTLSAQRKRSRDCQRAPYRRLPAGFQKLMATFQRVLFLHRCSCRWPTAESRAKCSCSAARRAAPRCSHGVKAK
jgi:hypothetical protein